MQLACALQAAGVLSEMYATTECSAYGLT
jgi:hypothetical protein